jgi:pimeloyl-ACP methyl ester carboxylesterase
VPLFLLAWLLGRRVLQLPFSRRLSTYAISASPDGVSERQLTGIIEDAGHCPAYLQLLVKAALMPGLRELALNSVPAHLVTCGKDRVVPAPRFSRHFTTHLPDNLKVTVLDGVGHVPMYEAPGRITEVITDFLETVQPADPGRRSTG